MKKNCLTLTPTYFQIIEFKACKQAHELHYAKKMQTSNMNNNCSQTQALTKVLNP
jgi:hypothetical protein